MTAKGLTLLFLLFLFTKHSYAQTFMEHLGYRVMIVCDRMPGVEEEIRLFLKRHPKINIVPITRSMVYKKSKKESDPLKEFVERLGLQVNIKGYELEKIGQLYNLDWVFHIFFNKKKINIVLYSAKMPIYVGFSLVQEFTLKQEEDIFYFLVERSKEILELFWDQWPLFKTKLIKSIHPDYLKIKLGTWNSNIHHESTPVIFDTQGLLSQFMPLGKSLSEPSNTAVKNISLPHKASANRFIIGFKTSEITSHELISRIKTRHINKDDMVILANENVFIKEEKEGYSLNYGLIPFKRGENGYDGWTKAYKIDDEPSHIPLQFPELQLGAMSRVFASGVEKVSGFDGWVRLNFPIGKRQLISLYHIHGYQGGRSMRSDRPSPPDNFFESRFMYSFLVIPTRLYYPSFYVGVGGGYHALNQYLSHPDIIIQRSVEWMGVGGMHVGLKLDVNRHRMSFEYGYDMAWGVDLMGSGQRINIEYQYQWSFITKFFAKYSMDNFSFDWDDYVNARVVKLELIQNSVVVGLNREWSL